ncbi:hypothetical protein F5Y15DRAFT_311805 [Xylariaceae sp. FL0016]|nr:hypothetical protein F5Y15DRAFT_311805 [Xylariaceae sp. FL0016]
MSSLPSSGRKASDLETPPGPYSSRSPGLYKHHGDPRTSSTQSLTPSLPGYEEAVRRKLLVIYIHGFMGNDTSFQSFPAHVHKYLKLALCDTHAIHSKIYPKYKTYQSIDVARDTFSKWLEPHESTYTDVILVGHSMGGLLAADVALIHNNRDPNRYFQHRILGTVNLDAPLLGLNPGIIVAGISSLFRKNDPPKPVSGDMRPSDPTSSLGPSGTTSQASTTSPGPSTTSSTSFSQLVAPAATFDPNFNPQFPNDVHVQDRGWWRNISHFVKKHSSEGLVNAATHHIMSHLEFGSCLLDIQGLKARYENIRKLEDVDDLAQYGFPHVPPQVRFVQYYTICHGYPKKPKSERCEKLDSDSSKDREGTKSPGNISPSPATPHPTSRKASVGERGNIHARVDSLDAIPKEDPTYAEDSDREKSSLELIEPTPMSEDELELPAEKDHDLDKEVARSSDKSQAALSESGRLDSDGQPSEEKVSEDQSPATDLAANDSLTDAVDALNLDLPPIPDLPAEPEPPNLEQYSDKDARKQAEKEAKRVRKAYDQAVKHREKAIKERQKIIDKRKKKHEQEAEKREKEARKQRQKEEAATSAVAKAVETSMPSSPNLTRAKSPDSFSKEASQTSRERSYSNGSSPAPSLSQSPSHETQQRGKEKEPKKKKDRKFCNVPKVNGQVDSKWISIFMKDMDEVAAHTGLFFSGEHYEKLVGEVGNTIVTWVQDDMTKRAIVEMQ